MSTNFVLAELPMLTRLFREAAWAPGVVLLLAVLLCDPSSTSQYWGLHYAGGAAMAFFFFKALVLARPGAPPAILYAFSFFAACGSAATWELAEFASDEALGTYFQKSLHDTTGDLASGVLGAVTCLALLAKTSRSALPRCGPSS